MAIACAAGAANAMADLRKGRPAGPLQVYPDDRNGLRFYYPPGDVVFAVDGDGKPDLHFLQIAYTGSRASGDLLTRDHRNLLSFGVEMVGPSAADVFAARGALPRGADLRPLPIRRIEAALVYATPTGEEALPEGHFESAGEEGDANIFWSERNYSLRLDNASAELFWDAMHAEKAVISIAYAFLAEGIPPDAPLDELTGSPKLVEAIEKKIGKRPGAEVAAEAEAGGEAAAAKSAPVVLVKAGANTLDVQAKRWPELFRQVKVSGSLPPGYAVLDVRCHDFSDGTRPDLLERRLEIDAEGAAGDRVRIETIFGSDEPDLYARTLRFPYAVRLDRPYRYRVTDLRLDGSEEVGAWRDAEVWTRPLDITSKVASLADYLRSQEHEEGDEYDDATN
jgi:hypothetical protein